jgi:hypothetical protein
LFSWRNPSHSLAFLKDYCRKSPDCRGAAAGHRQIRKPPPRLARSAACRASWCVPLPNPVKQPEVSAESHPELATATAAVLPQWVATERLPKAATASCRMVHPMFQDESLLPNRTAVNRHTCRASSRNRARKKARESHRIHRSERETSEQKTNGGQKRIPSRQHSETRPSPHYGASPYRNPFRVGSDQSGEGRRST